MNQPDTISYTHFFCSENLELTGLQESVESVAAITLDLNTVGEYLESPVESHRQEVGVIGVA